MTSGLAQFGGSSPCIALAGQCSGREINIWSEEVVVCGLCFAIDSHHLCSGASSTLAMYPSSRRIRHIFAFAVGRCLLRRTLPHGSVTLRACRTVYCLI